MWRTLRLLEKEQREYLEVANKKQTEEFFYALSTLSTRKMENQNVNPYTIKTTVIIDLGLKSFVRTLRHLLTVVLKSKRLKKYLEIKPKSRCIL